MWFLFRILEIFKISAIFKTLEILKTLKVVDLEDLQDHEDLLGLSGCLAAAWSPAELIENCTVANCKMR